MRQHPWLHGSSRILVPALIVRLCLSPSLAACQEDRAARAAVLFDQGKEALDKGDFEEATRKLAESQRLDPGIGTLLRLDRAYRGMGKTASAWAALKEARDLARRANDVDRRELAEARLAELDKQLMRVHLVVPAEARVGGLQITLNGELIGEGQWGEALPFDPGTYVVRATAPDRKPWSTSVQLETQGTTVEVMIPVLQVAETPLSQAPAAKTAASAPWNAGPPIAPMVSPDEGTWSMQRIFGGGLVALGVLGLGAGAVLGVVAIAKRDESNSNGHCRDGNLCDLAGLKLRDEGLAAGNRSTGAFITSGIVLAWGAPLLITAPATREDVTRVRVATGPLQLTLGGKR